MRTLLLAAALAGLTGCYKVEVTNLAEGAVGLEHTRKVHTVIAGLVPLNDVNVANFCGDKGALKVKTIHNFVDLLLTGITLGIYAPVTVKVTCKA